MSARPRTAIALFAICLVANAFIFGWALRTCARSDGPEDFEPAGLQ